VKHLYLAFTLISRVIFSNHLDEKRIKFTKTLMKKVASFAIFYIKIASK